MSKARVVFAMMALIWGSGSGVRAQDVNALRRRADSLATLWRDAQLVVSIQDSLLRTSLPPTMERAEAGLLIVIADPSRLPLEEATTAAWKTLDEFYGDAAQRVSGHPVVLRVVDELPRSSNRGSEIRIPKTISLPNLTMAIARTANVPRGDPALLEWLGMTLMPGDDPAHERTVVYVELVTGRAAVARRCFAGDRDSCTDALGLTSLDGAVLRWWSPAERRRIVNENYAAYNFRNKPALRALTTACVQAGVDSACVRLLEGADPATWPKPLSPSARAVLVRLALDHGGRGAYGRLVDARGGPIPARLAAVAGVPLDALVSEWQRTVGTARPKPVSVPFGNTLVALGWLGFLMVCALRSSRWRLG